MRWLPLLLLAGCTTTARPARLQDLAQAGQAWVAGSLAWRETPMREWLRVADERGNEIRLTLDQDAFLVALPPGRWRVSEIGGYRVAHDEPWFESRPGRAAYVGSLHPVRDAMGNLAVVVRDEQAAVQAALAARYGVAAPILEAGLLASALESLDDPTETVIALQPPSPVRSGTSLWIGYGYGWHGAWYSCRPYYGYPARRQHR